MPYVTSRRYRKKLRHKCRSVKCLHYKSELRNKRMSELENQSAQVILKFYGPFGKWVLYFIAMWLIMWSTTLTAWCHSNEAVAQSLYMSSHLREVITLALWSTLTLASFLEYPSRYDPLKLQRARPFSLRKSIIGSLKFFPAKKVDLIFAHYFPFSSRKLNKHEVLSCPS